MAMYVLVTSDMLKYMRRWPASLDSVVLPEILHHNWFDGTDISE